MTTNTMTIEEMVARRGYLAEQIDRLTDEKKQIDEKLLEDREPGTYDAGDWSLQVKAGARRLNEALFTERFPVTAYPHLFKPVPDLAAIKDLFSPADLEKFQMQNKPSLAVK